MTLNELTAYFSNYAQLHILLQHDPVNESKATFFCMNTDVNINEFIRNNPLDLIMILLVPDKQLAKSGDTYSWDKNVAYIVLQRTTDKTNGAIVAAQNICEQVGEDFLTRLIADRHTLVDSIEDGSIDVQPVGPVGDNHYGFMTMFKLVDLFDQTVNPARWIS